MRENEGWRGGGKEGEGRKGGRERNVRNELEMQRRDGEGKLGNNAYGESFLCVVLQSAQLKAWVEEGLIHVVLQVKCVWVDVWVLEGTSEKQVCYGDTLLKVKPLYDYTGWRCPIQAAGK